MTDFWAARPPEANDLVLRAGTGIGTTAAAALTYAMEIAGCETAAGASMGNAAMLAPEFVGAAGAGSLTSSTMLNTALHLLGAWLMEKPPVFASAINAYLAATSSMIPAALCQSNRVQWESLCAANIPALGMLTPAIIEKDLEYFGGMWPNNAAVGTGYSAALTALMPALAIPPPITPMGASPAAPVEAGAAVAEAAATSVAGQALQASGAAAGQGSAAAPGGMVGDLMQQVTGALQQGGQTASQLGQTVMGLPMQLGQGMFGPLQALPGLLGSFGRGADVSEPVTVAEVVPEGLRAAGPVSAGAAAMPTAGAGGIGAAPAGLTSYTRPTGGFGPDQGGRPTGLRAAGALVGTEPRAPVTPVGAAPVASGAGMLARPGGSVGASEVARVPVLSETRQSGS